MKPQLTAEERIHKAVRKLLDMPYYLPLAGVLMIGNRTVSETCPTAMTNGKDEVYGRTFVDGLSDPQLRGLILHETYHKMYRHLITWRHLYKANAQQANVACDYVINGQIVQEAKVNKLPVELPEGGLLDAKYDGMDAHQVYLALASNGVSNAVGNGGEGGQGFDEHDWDGAEAMDEHEASELARQIDEVVREGAQIASRLGSSGASRNLEDLLKPQVDWRQALREYISTQCQGFDYSTWRRPNRRFVSSGLYLPSGISEQVGEIVIAIDTSGSICGRALQRFLSEMAGICDTVKPERIHVLYWDTKVVSHETYEHGDLSTLTQSTKPKGGGGTDVSCVSEYLAKNGLAPKVVAVFTDGYLGGSHGQWTAPVIWCVLNNPNFRSNVGVVVNVESGS